MKICVLALFLGLISFATAGVFFPASYNSLGCWKDKNSRAIPTQEGKRKLLDGNYRSRDDAIQKCARVTFVGGYEVFAVQHGGWCATSGKARLTYREYGASNGCGRDGKGGGWANQVYELRKVGKVRTTRMGCWTDRADRAIPTLETMELVLDGRYQNRKQALKKCVSAAFARGYTMIALQNGGWCAGSRDAWKTFRKYGPSSACKADGSGGPWANQVYALSYEWVRTYAP